MASAMVNCCAFRLLSPRYLPSSSDLRDLVFDPVEFGPASCLPSFDASDASDVPAETHGESPSAVRRGEWPLRCFWSPSKHSHAPKPRGPEQRTPKWQRIVVPSFQREKR